MANTTFKGTLRSEGGYSSIATAASTGVETTQMSISSAGFASLDANTLATEAGTGITGGTGTVYKANVTVAGDLIKTEILIDLTGLRNTAAGDIIGKDGTSDVCHIGQITAALNGTIFAGEMTCIETPAGGEPDNDQFTANEGTGVEDGAVSSLTETVLVTAGQDWISTLSANNYNTAGFIAGAVPAADDYLYLVGGGGTTDADYTAGIFKITLYGYPA